MGQQWAFTATYLRMGKAGTAVGDDQFGVSRMQLPLTKVSIEIMMCAAHPRTIPE